MSPPEAPGLGAAAERPSEAASRDAARDKVLASFFVGERLKQIPARRKKLLVVLGWLAKRFEPGVRYPEREVNDRLTRHNPDFASIRRLLVDYGFLERDHGVYWRSEAPDPATADSAHAPVGDPR